MKRPPADPTESERIAEELARVDRLHEEAVRARDEALSALEAASKRTLNAVLSGRPDPDAAPAYDRAEVVLAAAERHVLVVFNARHQLADALEAARIGETRTALVARTKALATEAESHLARLRAALEASSLAVSELVRCAVDHALFRETLRNDHGTEVDSGVFDPRHEINMTTLVREAAGAAALRLGRHGADKWIPIAAFPYASTGAAAYTEPA